jgi:iron complex outermembrane receptor protein
MVSSSYGSFNTGLYKLQNSGKFPRFYYSVNVDKTFSGGFTQNSAYDSENFTGKVRYNLSENSSLQISSKYYDGFKEEPLPAASGTEEKYSRGYGSLDFIKTGSADFNLKLYRNFGEHNFSSGWESTDFTDGLMASAVSEIMPGNKLTAGAEFRRQGGENLSSSEKFNKYEYAAYLLDKQTLSRKLDIFLGGRYNIDEIAGKIFIGQAGLVYASGLNSVIRFNVSEGFRAPQINELYLFPASNEDLEAENALNYELGFNRQFSDRVIADLSLYRMTGQNMIRLEPNNSPPPMMLFKNSGEFEFRGAEVKINAAVTDFAKLQLGYSYLDSGEHTTGRPGGKADISIDIRFDRWGLVTKMQQVSSYYASDNSADRIDDYLTADMKANYKISGNLIIFGSVSNLLDRSYEIYADLPGSSAGLYEMPGRNYNLGMKYVF